MARADSESEVTPVEIPKKTGDNGSVRGSLKAIEGAPVALPHEDTGPIRAALISAAGENGGSGITAHNVAAALVDLMGGPGGQGGGDGGPPIDIKKFRKSNWLVNTAIAAIVGAISWFGGYQILKATVADHDKAIEQNAKATHVNAEAIENVKNDIGGVKKTVDNSFKVQVQLVEGVETLKKEAQTEKQKRLEEKVEEQKRRIRQLERESRLNR